LLGVGVNLISLAKKAVIFRKGGRMKDYEVMTLPPKEKQHFQLCEECGEYFDRREFDEMAFHCFGHKKRPKTGIKGRPILKKEIDKEALKLAREIPTPENLKPITNPRNGLRVFVDTTEDALIHTSIPEKGWGKLKKRGGNWEIKLENGRFLVIAASDLPALCSVSR
jgi:hypothetical protein